ncbi:MAG TPA: maleylpyruvate isomerase N-terminal domain-containing protein [Puia sp.]|jgi:uncharacterized protein (TIGR03083 family)|nr:maleylpyruvate isomerase N-terminal domain-containing protein [Puia sp.]
MTPSTGAVIDVRHLFRPLDDRLIVLLQSLDAADWDRPTAARLWTVKDVAAHLLDGNIRLLSIQRDRYYGEAPPASPSFEDLVGWLNGLNADWVKASRRISPGVLILLHRLTNDLVNAWYESLDLYEEAVFAVSWAGETRSLNWMHLAREYTEKWHHQQQIREATGRDGIMTREFFFPMIDTFLRGLPYTLRQTEAATDAVIKITITSDAGGDWYLKKNDSGWSFCSKREDETYAAAVSLPPEIAWKLFSKSIRPDEVHIKTEGDPILARSVLDLVAVMA